MKNSTIKTKRSGFTLIEAIIATAVFAFVVSSIIGVYLSAIQVDRKTRSLRAVSQNARFITEMITKEVRNGKIDYSSYLSGIIPAGNQDLYLINEAGELDHFMPSSSTCNADHPCDLQLAKTGLGTSNLNSSSVKVTNYKLFIQPVGDPYTSSKTYNEQPRVTLVLELTSNYGKLPSDVAKIDIQTTFSLRTYPPRE